MLLAATCGASAQTIYPLNRADILTGAKFDFKVEFPGTPAEADTRILVGGKTAAEFFGKPGSFVRNEDGQDYSAYVIRDVSVTAPGALVVEAGAGDKSARVTWDVYATPAPRRAKNVILFIGDGLSVAHRTAARILSKGIVEGKYGGELAIDDMPAMALISTAGSDSIVTDSANSMSAYATGHKSCVNALGVYCARNKNTLDHPKVETLGEITKRRLGMAVGVVTNTEIEDATPAGIVAHTRRRSDYNDIVEMFYKVKPEVIMGGGSVNFLAKSTPGSRRTDEKDYIKMFEADGYRFASTSTEMKAAGKDGATKLLGLFNTSNVDGALDRMFLKKGTVGRFPDQPGLTDQVRVSLDLLSKSDKGFMLMVESGRIDKYSHSLDAERAIYDTIMLDNAVKLAKDFAADRNDTLIIVVGDHAHPVSVIGTYDDDRPGQTPREKLGVYADAKTPNYPAPNADGYPDNVDVSRRLAFLFGTQPDNCFNAKPYLDGENVPAVAGPTPNTFIANEKNCTRPGAVRLSGNLPFDANAETHSGDDVVLTAMGPGSEMFHGHMPNVRVFKVIATALGLGE
jgi:alkaline phosphatase